MSYVLVVLALFAVVAGFGLLIARSAKTEIRLAEDRRKAVQVPEPPEPRVPADTSRTYPRPKNSRSKLNRVCPVCGTGAETTKLDGRVLGWPAHRSCAEWLGDWHPGKIPFEDADGPPPFSPGKTLIGHMERGQSADPGPIQVGPVMRPGSTNTIHYAGGTAVTMFGGGGGGAGTTTVEHWTREVCPDCGMEFAGTLPDIRVSQSAHRESGQCEQRRRKQTPAVFPEYCTCGKGFTGTAEENRRALDAHHASGECPHSVKG